MVSLLSHARMACLRVQLYETTIVRHGLMLVGPTMGGKTCCYRSLQKAMTKLAVDGERVCTPGKAYSFT